MPQSYYDDSDERSGLFGAESGIQFPQPEKRVLLNDSTDRTLGDNLYELSDKHISKLLQLKFHSNPMLLIRQLSSDLSAKEAELILLRKEKFQREHELYRLCTEYGNLSRMEIDKHLNALKIEADVHKVVSEMIDNAVNEAPRPPPPRKLSRTRIPRERSKDIRVNGTRGRAQTGSLEASSLNLELSISKSALVSEKADRKMGSWYSWLNRSEEALSSSSSASLSRFRTLNINNSKQEPERAPVELESMGFESDSIIPSPDPNIDRHGFYNDTTMAKPPPRTPEIPQDVNLTFAGGTISSFDTSKSISTLKQLGELHDAKNEEHVRRWDGFMREIKKEVIIQYHGEHETFGMKALNLKKHDGGLSKFFTSKEDENSEESRQLKDLHRLVNSGGIPPKYRNELWFELSGAKNKEVPGEYFRLLDIARTSSNEVINKHVEQINLDLHRTLPSNKYFNDMATSQPGPHFYKLQNILYAFVAYKPEVGYSQGMNKIVGNILLGVSEGNNMGTRRLGEEDVFWIFVSLAEDCLPKYHQLDYFHKDSLAYILRDCELVQRFYFPRHLASLHEHFVNLGVEIQVILLGWWLGAFTDNFVSVELWFKLLDSVLITECVEVKFVSYSLSFFKLFEKTLLDHDRADDIYKLMYNLKLSKVNQTNIRFQDLIQINNEFERSMSWGELEALRNR